MRDKETGKELAAMEIDRILDRAALDCAGYEWDIEDDRPDYKMGKYGLTLMGMKNPIYFNDKKDRKQVIDKIKNVFTYSTFTVDTHKLGKCPDCKKRLQLGEMEIDGKMRKIAQCEDCKYWEIIKET